MQPQVQSQNTVSASASRMRRSLRASAATLLAGGLAAAALTVASPALASTASCEPPVISGGVATVVCPYRGEPQTFTVPNGVSSLQLHAEGAEGGYSWRTEEGGGKGGSESGSLAVQAGETLTVLVGGAGGEEWGGEGGAGGYAGGGTGGNGAYGVFGATGGGGGSFVFRAAALEIAAGGGGGTGQGANGAGAGGGLEGGSGNGLAGGGGSQSSGGAANTILGQGATSGDGPANAADGSLLLGGGGRGASGSGENSGGGGGGGGYYGGGGGASWGGGGGGSGFLAPELTETSSDAGVRSGNGVVTISYRVPKPLATLTVHKAGAGVGTVTSAPAGIDCGSDCAASFPVDSKVVLTATAGKGSTFVGWSGSSCAGQSACTVSLGSSTTVTADFAHGAPTLGILAAAKPVQPGTVGFYLNDEVLLENSSSRSVCKQGGDAKLDANERRADSFGFGEVLLTGCESGSRVVVDKGGRARLYTSGEIIESTSWKIEMPEGCTYALGALRGSFSLPSVLEEVALVGVAKLAGAKHGVRCSSTATVQAELTLGGQGGAYTAQLM